MAKRVRALRVARPHADMKRYLGDPSIIITGTGEIWQKPSNVTNYWMTLGVGRFASFGIMAVPGFWDGERFEESWDSDSKVAAKKYWPQKWRESRSF